MNKFQQLIQTLQTDLIVLIDDDFTPVSDIQEILTFVCFMNPLDRNLLMRRLGSINSTLIKPINELIEGLGDFEILPLDLKFIEAGLITNLLDEKGSNALKELSIAIIQKIEDLEVKKEISELSMMYGLRLKASTETYNPFFDSLSEIGINKSIRLYRGLIGEEFTRFEEEIRTVNEQRNNKFTLLIVDRQLGEGQLGVEIIDNLREGNSQINRFFSVLYTSQEIEQIEPSDLRSFFHIQLRKDDSNALEKVSEALALSAFATFFNQIYESRKESLDSANRLIIGSGIANMLYLAGMAHTEGDTVFNIFNKWFDLLSDKKVQDKLLFDSPDGFDMNFMISLTSLINSEFISTIIGSTELDEYFHKEVNELASFEIFDRKINNFCSPPSPGDLFEIDGEIFLLAGQECDLVVRSNGGGRVGRNEKLAELVKCSFLQVNQDAKVEDSSKDSSVSLNHFEYNNTKGVLRINLGEKDFFDFRLLDLCCLNEDGEARIVHSDFPSERILNLLPSKWSEYIPNLIEELDFKLKVHKFIIAEGINPYSISGDLSFKIPYQEVVDTLTFPVKRISRMKGQFREYCMQRYWQYKTRKGLNTIGVYQRNQVQVQSIRAGYPYDLNEIPGDHLAWVQLTGDRNRNSNKASLDLVVMKRDLLEKIDVRFKPFLEKIEQSEIIISPKDGFLQGKIKFSRKWDRNNVSLTVVFPLYNEFSDYTIDNQDRYTLHEIFGKDFVRSNPYVKKSIIVVEKEQTPLMGEGGALHYVKLEDLMKAEIHLPDKNIKICFDAHNGKFYNGGAINQELNG